MSAQDGIRRTKGIQSGPRSQQIVSRVAKATLAELDRVGFGRMTMAGVARTAGVDRATLYRRWPKKSDLLATLLEAEIQRIEDFPTQGTLEDTLRHLTQGIAQNMAGREGRALGHALTSGDPELQPLSALARDQILQSVRNVFERAIERGELSADADVDMMSHILCFGTVHWAMDHGAPLSESDCNALIAASLASAKLD